MGLTKMEPQNEITSNIDTSTDSKISTQIETTPLPDVPKTKRKRTSKRRKIKPNGMQNIRLPVKLEVADQMTEIADKRGMPTTLNLYRLYIERGIEADLKRLAEQETMNEIVVREAVNKVMGNESDS